MSSQLFLIFYTSKCAFRIEGLVFFSLLRVTYDLWIKINDVQKRIRHYNISSFADDTRVSKQITHQTDCVELQDELNAIIQWSREDNMKLHEDKFELISIKANPILLMHELPFSIETCTYQVSESIKLFPIDCLKARTH